jgi:hypothetical protein
VPVLRQPRHLDRAALGRRLLVGPPSAIPYAFTKSGVSCTYDPATARFVVAYAGSGEERLWQTSRTVSGTWAVPRPLPPAPQRWLTPSTNEVPHVSADHGRLTVTWFPIRTSGAPASHGLGRV